MRARNRVREALREGRIPLGMELMLGSERIVEICGWSGFDCIHLDQEHTPFGFEAIESSVRAAEAAGISSFVRVAEALPKDISRVLETGATGVVVPNVRGADDVQQALDAMFYEPHGTRGMCPVTRAAHYRDDSWDEYVEWVRSEVMLMPLIENSDALANIDEICAMPDIDVISFGAGDLGQSMGVGARGLSEPVVLDAFKKTIEVAGKHGTVMDAMPFIGDDVMKSVEDLLDMGVGMITYDADALMLSRECSRFVGEFGDLVARRGSEKATTV